MDLFGFHSSLFEFTFEAPDRRGLNQLRQFALPTLKAAVLLRILGGTLLFEQSLELSGQDCSLSIEELFVNMVNYNTETDRDIMIEMKKIDHGIEVSLTDFDVERFDPTLAGDVNIDAPLSERTPGGLGLYLVLKMADSIHYEYDDRKSKIAFTNRVVGE